MDPIERVARLLCRQQWGHPDSPDFYGKPMWKTFADQAADKIALHQEITAALAPPSAPNSTPPATA